MKVKVSKELYEALKEATVISKNSIVGVIDALEDGYVFEYDVFKIFNSTPIEKLKEIQGKGYELEESLTANEILNNVQNILASQTAKGFQKYGEYVKSENLTAEQWIDHACEELVDTLVYLQALKERLKNER